MSPSLRILACGLATALVVAGPACGKKKKKSEQEPAAAAERAARLAGLGAIPAGTDQIVGLDVARLARSPLVTRAVSVLLAGDPELAKDLDAILAQCKIDVARDLRHLWLGMVRSKEAVDQAILVLEGKIGEGQLSECVGRTLGAAGGRLTAERVSGRNHYHADQPGERPDVWFAAVGDGVVAVTSSPALLVAAAGDGPKLADDAAMTALIERAGKGHALWFAGTVPPEIGQGLAGSGHGLAAPTAMFGHLDLDGALDATLAVVMANPADATLAVELTRGQLGTLALVAQAQGLGRLVNRIEPSAEAETLFLRLNLPEPDVRALVATAVDTGGHDDQNASPSGVEKGVESDGQGDAGPGDEAPVRK
jgi:hypothetical protein